jgi:hypothetical protein
MALIPIRAKERPVTAPPSQAKRETSLTSEDYEVQAVTIVPEGEKDGRVSSYSAVLEVDLTSGRVGSRRKEGVRSIIIPLEVKDIPILAQLAGRPIGILHWIDSSLRTQDDLQQELNRVTAERDALQRKVEEMRKQVHFLIEDGRTS